jgi:hypothetical protein
LGGIVTQFQYFLLSAVIFSCGPLSKSLHAERDTFTERSSVAQAAEALAERSENFIDASKENIVIRMNAAVKYYRLHPKDQNAKTEFNKIVAEFDQRIGEMTDTVRLLIDPTLASITAESIATEGEPVFRHRQALRNLNWEFRDAVLEDANEVRVAHPMMVTAYRTIASRNTDGAFDDQLMSLRSKIMGQQKLLQKDTRRVAELLKSFESSLPAFSETSELRFAYSKTKDYEQALTEMWGKLESPSYRALLLTPYSKLSPESQKLITERDEFFETKISDLNFVLTRVEKTLLRSPNVIATAQEKVLDSLARSKDRLETALNVTPLLDIKGWRGLRAFLAQFAAGMPRD